MPDFSSILQRSWEIIKKNKWLLVYGLVLAGFGAGGVSFNGSFPSSNNINFKDLQKGVPKDLPEKTSQVLGAFTSAIAQWFKTVPPVVWGLLILGITLTILIGVIIRQVILCWARGSLIAGVQMADQNQTVSLSNTASLGIKSIKNLILLSLIMFGITLGLFLVMGLLWIAGFFVF